MRPSQAAADKDNQQSPVLTRMLADEDSAFKDIMARIDEYGLAQNLLDIEARGFTVLKGALSEDQIERAKAAILRRAEKNLIDHPRHTDTLEDHGLGATAGLGLEWRFGGWINNHMRANRAGSPNRRQRYCS